MKQNIFLFYKSFNQIITRSKSIGVNMSIAAEVLEHSENLIKPVVANQSFEELCKLKE